ncbi:hypothetical protein [Dokdonella sp.]|uniref:hypothetical protein n=1 Tax=Dokdonella sp. TaxID=2291710 RepID=UPI003C3F1040
MFEHAIPVKTATGRLEIDERKQKLGARHRMVLISINGERSVASIRKQFAAINEIDTLLEDLLVGGMIEVANEAEIAVEPTAAAITAPPPEMQPVVEARIATPASAEASPPASLATGSDEGLHEARDYMSRTLSAKVGIRAFLFTQKVDRCQTREALHELLPEFRRLLRKNLDAGRVNEFSANVEQLIGQG